MAAPQASSRLELLQARFQQKQLQEKEQKLLQLYDQQQQRAYQVVQRGSAGSNGSNHATSISQQTVTRTSNSSHTTSTSQGGKVRQMFDERRQTSVKGIDRSYPLEPLENKPRKQTTGNGVQKNGNLTVNRQSVTVKRVTRADVNSNLNNGKPVVSYHEEITRESFGPSANQEEDEFENENHVTAQYSNGNHRNETNIEEVLDEDTIEKNRMMAKLHLMDYDETLKHRVKNDLESEEFPEEYMLDVPDKLPKQNVTKKLSQAEARLERFKNANAKRANSINRTSTMKKRTDPILPAKSTSSEKKMMTRGTRKASDKRSSSEKKNPVESRKSSKLEGSNSKKLKGISDSIGSKDLQDSSDSEKNVRSRQDDNPRFFCKESEIGATICAMDSKTAKMLTSNRDELLRRGKSSSPRSGSPKFFCKETEKGATTYAIDSKTAKQLSSDVVSLRSTKSSSTRSGSPKFFCRETGKGATTYAIDSKTAKQLSSDVKSLRSTKSSSLRSGSPKFFCKETEKGATTYAIDSKTAKQLSSDVVSLRSTKSSSLRSGSPKFFCKETEKGATTFEIDVKSPKSVQIEKSSPETENYSKNRIRRSESPTYFYKEPEKSATFYKIDSKNARKFSVEDDSPKNIKKRDESTKSFCKEFETSATTFAIDSKASKKYSPPDYSQIKKQSGDSPNFFSEQDEEKAVMQNIYAVISSKSRSSSPDYMKDTESFLLKAGPNYKKDISNNSIKKFEDIDAANTQGKFYKRETSSSSLEEKGENARNYSKLFKKPKEWKSRNASDKFAEVSNFETSGHLRKERSASPRYSIQENKKASPKLNFDNIKDRKFNKTFSNPYEKFKNEKHYRESFAGNRSASPRTSSSSKRSLEQSFKSKFPKSEDFNFADFSRFRRKSSSSPQFYSSESERSASVLIVKPETICKSRPKENSETEPKEKPKIEAESEEFDRVKKQSAMFYLSTNEIENPLGRTISKDQKPKEDLRTELKAKPKTKAKVESEEFAKKKEQSATFCVSMHGIKKPERRTSEEKIGESSKEFIRASVSRFFSEQCEQALSYSDASSEVRSAEIDAKFRLSGSSSPVSLKDMKTEAPKRLLQFYPNKIDGIADRSVEKVERVDRSIDRKFSRESPKMSMVEKIIDNENTNRNEREPKEENEFSWESREEEKEEEEREDKFDIIASDLGEGQINKTFQVREISSKARESPSKARVASNKKFPNATLADCESEIRRSSPKIAKSKSPFGSAFTKKNSKLIQDTEDIQNTQETQDTPDTQETQGTNNRKSGLDRRSSGSVLRSTKLIREALNYHSGKARESPSKAREVSTKKFPNAALADCKLKIKRNCPKETKSKNLAGSVFTEKDSKLTKDAQDTQNTQESQDTQKTQSTSNGKGGLGRRNSGSVLRSTKLIREALNHQSNKTQSDSRRSKASLPRRNQFKSDSTASFANANKYNRKLISTEVANEEINKIGKLKLEKLELEDSCVSMEACSDSTSKSSTSAEVVADIQEIAIENQFCLRGEEFGATYSKLGYKTLKNEKSSNEELFKYSSQKPGRKRASLFELSFFEASGKNLEEETENDVADSVTKASNVSIFLEKEFEVVDLGTEDDEVEEVNGKGVDKVLQSTKLTLTRAKEKGEDFWADKKGGKKILENKKSSLAEPKRNGNEKSGRRILESKESSLGKKGKEKKYIRPNEKGGNRILASRESNLIKTEAGKNDFETNKKSSARIRAEQGDSLKKAKKIQKESLKTKKEKRETQQKIDSGPRSQKKFAQARGSIKIAKISVGSFSPPCKRKLFEDSEEEKLSSQSNSSSTRSLSEKFNKNQTGESLKLGSSKLTTSTETNESKSVEMTYKRAKKSDVDLLDVKQLRCIEDIRRSIQEEMDYEKNRVNFSESLNKKRNFAIVEKEKQRSESEVKAAVCRKNFDSRIGNKKELKGGTGGQGKFEGASVKCATFSRMVKSPIPEKGVEISSRVRSVAARSSKSPEMVGRRPSTELKGQDTKWTKRPTPMKGAEAIGNRKTTSTTTTTSTRKPTDVVDAAILGNSLHLRDQTGETKYDNDSSSTATTTTTTKKSDAFVIDFDEQTPKENDAPLVRKSLLRKQSTEKQASSTQSVRPPSSVSSTSSGSSMQGQVSGSRGKTAPKAKTSISGSTTYKGSASNKSGGCPSTADNLVPCKICGRRFAQDRVTLHEQICAKTGQKKRKQFDAMMYRVRGTDLEPFVKKGLAKKPPEKCKKPEIKSNWRRKHEDFINAIRSAKQVQAHLAAGGKLSDLPPPPVSDNCDYIQCPHCGRKFNQAAAERHIPKCEHMLHNKPIHSRAPKPRR